MSLHENSAVIPQIQDRDFIFALGTRVSTFDWENLEGSDPEILTERAAILAQTPEESLVYLPEADPLIAEARSLFNLPFIEGMAGLEDLTVRYEPDIVLLKRGEAEPYMVAGAVCFPSAWSPEEKLGKPMSEIHAPVPTLNPHLGGQINRFLMSLRTDKPYERWGWGVAATSQRNLHPNSEYPRITSVQNPDDLWIRWEHQGFHVLPESNGLLFSIHPVLQPLSEIVDNPNAAQALRRQIETMDQAIADYKGISPVKELLLSVLRSKTHPL